MIRKALTLACFAALCGTGAAAQQAPDAGKWNLMLITDGQKAGAGVSAVMDSETACKAAARILVNPDRPDLHSQRIAYCVNSATGDTVTIRKD